MFKSGQSGNPAGRPKANVVIRDFARQYTDKAIQTLVQIAGNEKISASARVQAANALLDRGWGKPHQYTENVSVKGSLIDFLDSLDTSEVEVIDI